MKMLRIAGRKNPLGAISQNYRGRDKNSRGNSSVRCMCSRSQDGTGGSKIMHDRNQMTQKNFGACVIGIKMMT